MHLLTTIYLFVLGTAFGSFALALVDRMKSGKDWLTGRSECDSCGHKLRPADLVPIFSWLGTRGRCRYCKAKLSAYYPATEVLCGLAFALSFIFAPYAIAGYGIALFCLWLLGLVIMNALVVFDLRWFLLPNKLVYPLIALAAAHRTLVIVSNVGSLGRDIVTLVLGLAVGSGVFFGLHLVSAGKWIGDGDVRLGVAMGLFLAGPLEAWLAIFVASVLGVVVAAPHLARSKKALRMKLPYGPMLVFGLIFAYLFGSQIINWYSVTFLVSRI